MISEAESLDTSPLTDEKRFLKLAKRQNFDEPVDDINVLQEVFNIVMYIWILIIFIFLINTFVGMRTVVQGPSMSDTLMNGESLWVDKLAYRFHKPERFDIVVFPVYHEDYVYYVKRVIGLPGETVSLSSDGFILINGEPIDDKYGPAIDFNHEGRLEKEVVLGDDEYFVLGDNRNNSTDSRDDSVGNVSEYELTGRVSLRLYPFSKIGRVN